MRLSLPIDDVLPDLIDALRDHPCVVLRAPTGAGKTTRVPPALLDAGLAGGGRVVLLEPRRVAARAAARRMAHERSGAIGDEIGYQMRFERRVGKNTRVVAVTEGVLVGLLQRDPFLEDVGVLVFDEFHERNLDSDLALAMARRVQHDVRDDLRIVVMSATLDPGPIASWLNFDGREAPIVESEGRLFPVEKTWLDRPDDRRVEALAASGARRMLREAPDNQGSVLVFLPGVGEIRRTAEMLEDLDAPVFPLYGDLPPEQQDAALSAKSGRRVVLATNVAETSVTVEGVHAVVDSGLARVMRSDPSCGLDRLELERISRVSAEQRAGRAGRQGPGRCLRLWTKHDDRSLAEHPTPEIGRVDLAGPALQLLAWGENDLDEFGWFEAPDPTSLRRALDLLRDLGAIDEEGRATKDGQAMARLPLHPRLARLLLEGRRRGVIERTAKLAALLAERDVVQRTDEAPSSSPCDLLDRVEALELFEQRRRPMLDLHRGRARHVLRAADQLISLARRRLGETKAAADDEDLALRRSLLAAYPDRVARRREPGSDRAVMVGGRGLRLSETSAVRDGELLLAVELVAGRRGAGSEAWVRLASQVPAEWLEIETVDEVVFDPERGRAIGRRQTRYRDLVFQEKDAPASPDEAARVLVEAAAENLERALPLDATEVVGFLTRVRSLREWMPELELSAFGDDELREMLPLLCAGKRSFEELRRVPLVDMLRGRLLPKQSSALEQHAPERFQVPSGSKIRLQYEPGEAPVLAARIQELFGQLETPRVANGRVAVKVHLLAPNQRPQQITDDLASFWKNTYAQVRKDLRARYPKHAWPEDPYTARAERRPRRKR